MLSLKYSKLISQWKIRVIELQLIKLHVMNKFILSKRYFPKIRTIRIHQSSNFIPTGNKHKYKCTDVYTTKYAHVIANYKNKDLTDFIPK